MKTLFGFNGASAVECIFKAFLSLKKQYSLLEHSISLPECPRNQRVADGFNTSFFLPQSFKQQSLFSEASIILKS